MSKDMIDFKVREIAEMLNITEYLDRKPKNLSGGQRQRVAIGRAIVRNPKVLLMDEPLSNLDAKLRNQMRAEIIKIRQRIQTTFIYVTHDQIEAMTLGDRIVVMKDGYIQQVGTPQEVFDHPRNLFVSGFIGIPQMNYFDAKLLKKEDGYYVDINGYVVKPSKEKQERLKKSKVEEQDILVGVRPDHMSITDKGITGRVNVTELMGTTSHIHATVNNKDIIAIVPNDGVHVDYINKDVTFGFNGNVIHMFSKENERNLEFLSEVLASEFRFDDDLAKKQAEHEKK
jgi:multiple sugar transport system ATP-binding protein